MDYNKTMKSLILFLLAAGVGLVVGGCASPNVNPASARPHTGYVDFYVTNTNDVYWDITDLKTNKKIYYKFAPFEESILRLALAPGQYQLQINFLNHVIETPGMADVEVADGMITPMMVSLLPAGSVIVQSKGLQAGTAMYGRSGQIMVTSHTEAASYDIDAEPQAQVPYQTKAKMSYGRPPSP